MVHGRPSYVPLGLTVTLHSHSTLLFTSLSHFTVTVHFLLLQRGRKREKGGGRKRGGGEGAEREGGESERRGEGEREGVGGKGAEPESALSALRNVESYCRQIKIWTTKNKFKLNEQKTEVLLCGPSSRRETVPVDCLSVGEASIPFSNVVKTLGVTLDAELSMEQHVSAVVRSCFFHIRSLSKVRPYITYKAASSIAVCLILSKLDYCNSLLSGLPQKQIKRLQAVQNAAARTVMKCKKTDHITPILRQLHWLPIQKLIHHKILSATYRSVHDNTPLYLSDLLQKHSPSRLLRSASRSLLDVPGPRDSKTKRYGQRAFRYVAPSLWNVLPENIKEKDSIQSFRPSLKTHFFTQG